VFSVYDLKLRLQTLPRPLAASLARRGVTTNQVTPAAVLLEREGTRVAWE